MVFSLVFGSCSITPKKYALFTTVQETYGLKHLPVIIAATTRWLSHGKACVRIIDWFVQVIDTLDASLDEKYNPVHGIREQLLNKNSVAAILILCDILRPVVHFSNYLQGNHDISQVMIRWLGTRNLLMNYIIWWRDICPIMLHQMQICICPQCVFYLRRLTKGTI